VEDSAGILPEHSVKESPRVPLLKKMQNCFDCAFFNNVREEEGKNFIMTQDDAKNKIFL
jgi:hypothetical protein